MRSGGIRLKDSWGPCCPRVGVRSNGLYENEEEWACGCGCVLERDQKICDWFLIVRLIVGMNRPMRKASDLITKRPKLIKY